MTQNEIFKVIEKHIRDYYHELSPIIYERTWSFLNSLIKTQVVTSNGMLSCKVQIDENYLKYKYCGDTTERVTGLQVANWANNHQHGGLYDDDFGRFWDDAIEEIGLKPGIMYLMKKNLKKCGVPAK